MRTSMNTQPEPLSRRSTNPRGKKISMYGLDTSQRQLVSTPEDKFKDKWNLIQLMRKKKVKNKLRKDDN